MNEAKTEEVKNTLQAILVHDSWVSVYRTSENEHFYDLAFDYLMTVYGPTDADAVLDAGCGTGTKTVHLAKRGYTVVAVDISDSVLDMAREVSAQKGYQDGITYMSEDVTDLSFQDGQFGRILCWGVLMHVPDVEKAIGELARITRPGGTIVVSEGNMRSLQAIGIHSLKKIVQWSHAEIRRTNAGVEYWEETAAGKLVTRQTDIKWLIASFEAHGVHLVERRAGQFTEIFTLLPWRPLRLLVHGFNNFWFRHIRYPGPAFGNLLIFRKAI